MRAPARRSITSPAHEAARSGRRGDRQSVVETIATGVPRAVPNSSPAAPASSGPGNDAQLSTAATTMNTSGPAAP